MGDYLRTFLAAIAVVGALCTAEVAQAAYVPSTLATVKCDGVTDDAPAIIAALNAGLSFTLPPGVCIIGSNLMVDKSINDGGTLSGSGSWGGPDAFNGSPGNSATILRPTSVVTRVIVIDGTPFPGGGVARSWVQGFKVRDLVIDMVNMTDVSTNAAINQIQAWDARYDNVRVINDGVNKRAWLLNGGAFTTQMNTVQGHIIDLEGTSNSFGVTTVTMVNPDIGRLIANYANGIRVEGGAIQTSTAEAVYLRNVGGIYLHTDIESSGGTCCAAYDMDNTVNGVFLQNTMEGWGGPLFNGAPSALGFVDLDLTVAIYTPGCPFAFTSGYESFNNCGTGANNNRSSWLSGSSTQQEYHYIGRTAGESIWGVSAHANDFVNGIAPGDTIFGSTASGAATWLMAGYSPVVKMTASSLGLVNNAYFLSNPPLSFLSGSSSLSSYVYFGLTSGTSLIGVASAANSFANGVAAGDMVLGSYSTGEHTWLLCAGNPCWKGDAYGHQYTQGYPAPSAGTGTASVASNGNDNAFAFTSGSSVTSSTVNFAAAWSVVPKCVVTSNSAAAWPYILSISTTALTVGWSTTTSGESAYVQCEG
jgi:hypothetical protein